MHLKLILIISLTISCASCAVVRKNNVVIATSSTTSAPWLQKLDDTIGCYGGKSKFFEVYSNYSIDSTLPNFFDYFTALKIAKNIPNANSCCLKCGASGPYSKCIGFDFNAQLNTCQMYSVNSEEVYYIEDGNKFYYTLYHGQAAFLTGYNNESINYVLPQSNHYSAVYVDGTGVFNGIS